MYVTYDSAKRLKTLNERGLGFEDAIEVFAGTTYEVEDRRKAYGETRIVCYGHLRARLVVVCYTPRNEGRRIISMRKANEREQAHYASYLGQ